jgi:predicted transcriptional regulator
VPGPVAQTTIVSTLAASSTGSQTTYLTTTASTTFSYSSTAPIPQGGYSVLSGPTTSTLLNYYGFTALISWAVFGAALIWRGHVRSVWGESRFSYDTFRLLVKMRGAQTRLKLMRTLNSPKNKLQLATALGIDWKAVDKHVQVLEKNGLIQATSTSGTATFYEVTEKGKSLIQVLEQLSGERTVLSD